MIVGSVGLRHLQGTIRFRPDEPLPDELIVRLVRARIVEIDALG